MWFNHGVNVFGQISTQSYSDDALMVVLLEVVIFVGGFCKSELKGHLEWC